MPGRLTQAVPLVASRRVVETLARCGARDEWQTGDRRYLPDGTMPMITTPVAPVDPIQASGRKRYRADGTRQAQQLVVPTLIATATGLRSSAPPERFTRLARRYGGVGASGVWAFVRGKRPRLWSGGWTAVMVEFGAGGVRDAFCHG